MRPQLRGSSSTDDRTPHIGHMGCVLGHKRTEKIHSTMSSSVAEVEPGEEPEELEELEEREEEGAEACGQPSTARAFSTM